MSTSRSVFHIIGQVAGFNENHNGDYIILFINVSDATMESKRQDDCASKPEY